MQEILPLEKREAEDGTSTTIMLALQKPSNNFIGIHICKVAHEIHGSESPVCTTHTKMLRHQGIEIRFLIKRLDVIHMLLQMQSGHSYWYQMCVVSTPVWLVLCGFKRVRRGFVF
jgi:hypothetical protein